MIIYTVLIVVIAIIGVLMATVVLLQSGKGGGLAGISGGGGGGGATQLLGARQAPDILEKATWVLATLFITLCILTNFFVDTAETRQSIIQSQGQQLPAQAPATAPPAATPAPAAPADGGSQPSSPGE